MSENLSPPHGSNNDAVIGSESSASYPDVPHSYTSSELLATLSSSTHGLSCEDATERLSRFGPNTLPRSKPPNVFMVFLHQFASPLIYVLGVAAIISLLIQEYSDAGFIAGVLFINAIIGTVQEYSAQRAAEALNELVTTSCRVLRDGDTYEVSAEGLVPGDVLLLESGDRVPADLRLLSCRDLEVDESLLTGESMAVLKDAQRLLENDSALGDRCNMAFAGTMVSRGRGKGVVVGTAPGHRTGAYCIGGAGQEGGQGPAAYQDGKVHPLGGTFGGFCCGIDGCGGPIPWHASCRNISVSRGPGGLCYPRGVAGGSDRSPGHRYAAYGQA